MAARLGFLGAENRPEAIDLAEGQRPRLGVELTALREIGLAVAEVVELEKIGRALARGRREHRCVEEHEAALMEKVAARGLDFAADAQDRMLTRGPHPQMPQIEQKGDAVVFRRYRVVRRRAVYLVALDRELASTWRALVLAHHARHFERRFLREVVRRRERLGAEVRERGDALANPGTVANQQEMHLPARAPVVEPSLERHLFADMLAKVFDISPRHVSKFKQIGSVYLVSTTPRPCACRRRTLGCPSMAAQLNGLDYAIIAIRS